MQVYDLGQRKTVNGHRKVAVSKTGELEETHVSRFFLALLWPAPFFVRMRHVVEIAPICIVVDGQEGFQASPEGGFGIDQT